MNVISSAHKKVRSSDVVPLIRGAWSASQVDVGDQEPPVLSVRLHAFFCPLGINTSDHFDLMWPLRFVFFVDGRPVTMFA